MGVTSYYSFGGEIIGEETGGVRRDYLTDALGSVTATVTEAGVVENTYRYKPYGETLAKTGSGSDPKFLWNGKWGYRSGSENIGLNYVRARFYCQKSGNWITRDEYNNYFLGSPIFDVNYYIYGGNSPVVLVDLTGLMSVIRQRPRDKWRPKPGEIAIGVPPLTDIYGKPVHCSGRESGMSGCNHNTGKPFTIMCSKHCAADQECTKRHEKDHREVQNTCCGLYAACRNSSRNSKERQDCDDAWGIWLIRINSWMECRGHTIGKGCREGKKISLRCNEGKNIDDCKDIDRQITSDNIEISKWCVPGRAEQKKPNDPCPFPIKKKK